MIVACMPIKLNSSRVPRKSIRKLGSRPLLHWALEALLQVPALDEVVVYCSSPEIEEYLFPKVRWMRRSPVLDSNYVDGTVIYREFVRDYPLQADDILVLHHATSPFVRSETIADCIAKVVSRDYDSAATVLPLLGRMWRDGAPLCHDPAYTGRTQDMQPSLWETNATYVLRPALLWQYNRRVGFQPYFRSVSPIEALDIDTRDDYALANAVAHAAELGGIGVDAYYQPVAG